jgi:hypothetical protein
MMGKYKDAFLHGRLAITHSHNFVIESSALCKTLVQCQRSISKLTPPQPASTTFLYTTLNCLHTFNMVKELEVKDDNVEENKAFYFEDRVRVLDKLLLQYNGILKEFMKRITETEKHLSKDEEDIVEFASSLSPKATTVPENKNIRKAKIKRRNAIGLKSNHDFVFTVTADDMLYLRPLRVEDFIPDLSNAACEVNRDFLYEKITLLAISYYIYGTQWKMQYEKTKLESRLTEATYWNKAAAEICLIFLPKDSPIAEHILGKNVMTPRKSSARKMLKENSSSVKVLKSKKTPLTSPSKDTKYRLRKLNSLGIKKRPLEQRTHNITQMKILTKYFQ